MALAAHIGQNAGVALLSVGAIAGAHLYSAVRSIRSVPLASLNASRLELLIQSFMQQQQQQQQEEAQRQSQHQQLSQQQQQKTQAPGSAYGSVSQHEVGAGYRVPSPAELAKLEPLWPQRSVVVGGSLDRLAAVQGQELARLLPLFSPRRYILLPQACSTAAQGGQRQQQCHQMRLLLHEQATAADALLAFLHAWLLLRPSGAQQQNNHSGGVAEVEQALGQADTLLPSLLAELHQAGWDTDRVVVESKRQRVTWSQAGCQSPSSSE